MPFFAGHDSKDVLNATAFGLMKEKSMLVGIGMLSSKSIQMHDAA